MSSTPPPEPQGQEPTNIVPVAKNELTAEDIYEPHILAKSDPEVVKIVLRGVNAGLKPTYSIPIEERRAHPEKYRVPWARDTTGWERVADQEISSEDGAKIPIKVYHPDPKTFGEGPYGVHLNFHGKSCQERSRAVSAY